MVNSKLGFSILFSFAMADGRYDRREGQCIMRYFKKNLQDEFNVEWDEDYTITAGNVNSIAQKYFSQFNAEANDKEKEELALAALEVITADDRISKEEKELFIRMGEVFNINAFQMLNSYMKFYC